MTNEHDFFEQRMSYTLWLTECLRKFTLFLGSKVMLITYVGVISIVLVIVGPFLYTQNIGTSEVMNQITSSTCRLKEGFMIDCLPHMEHSFIDSAMCESRSCCFKSINRNREAPVCYRRLPSSRSFKISDEGIIPSVENSLDTENPPISSKLTYAVKSFARGHILVEICTTNKENGRCEENSDKSDIDESGLNVQLSSNDKKFQIVVSRNDTLKTTLFDSSQGAIVIGQKMSEISTLLSSPYIFGLGGHPASFAPNKTSNFTIKSLFSSNLIENPQRTSIKSFLSVDEDKSFYGILLESKTPAEVELIPGLKNKKPLLIFRSMGGVMAIHVFSGPKPSDVSEQIAKAIGEPKLPPPWILGIHLCRSNGELMKSGEIETNFPYDSDCLDRGVISSGFKLMYSKDEIAKISALLRTDNKKIILTNPLPIDPKENINKKMKLVNDRRNNEELIGDYQHFKNVSIPDLLGDTKEWMNALATLLDKTSNPDALYISDNAPDLKIKNINNEKCKSYFSHKELRSEFESNLCHLYNYGRHSESNESHSDIRDNYPSIVLAKYSELSKNLFSEFASLGIQKHGWILSSGIELGHQEVNEWTLLEKDLQTTLEYGLAGLNIRSTCPCTLNMKGKIRDEDACYRWFFLGAFMPAINTLQVSPNDFKSGNYKKWIRIAFQNRYKLHPYYFTTLVHGGPLIRPIFYEFPWDQRTFGIGYSQVMIGDGLLLVPVLNKLAHESGIISVYFPRGTWYDFWSGAITHGRDEYEKMSCFKFELPLFLKRGRIIPTFESGESSIETTYEKQNYGLIIGLDCDITPAKSSEKTIQDCSADGSLYLADDKILLLRAIRTKKEGKVIITPPHPAWTACGSNKGRINSIVIYGIEDQMKYLTLPNGTKITVDSESISAQAYFSKKDKRLHAKNLDIDFCNKTKDLKISWTFIMKV